LIQSPRRVVVLAAFALLALAPATAAAEESERNAYVVVKGGPYFPTATNAFNLTGAQVFTWPTSYTIEGGVGANWGLFGLQLSAGYITTGTSTIPAGQTSANAVPILLLARLRLPILFLAPYLEGGAGVSIATSTFTALVGGQSLSNTNVGFEAVGGAGCDLYFGPLIVGAELRYIWLQPYFTFSANNVVTLAQNLNMSGITLEAYVGYRF
jgi:hypothetical protein